MSIHTVSRDYGPTLLVADLGITYIMAMPVRAWIDLPNHSLWRKPSSDAIKDYRERTQSAKGALGAKLRWVVAAELDGKLVKLDGHMRAALWAKGKLPR